MTLVCILPYSSVNEWRVAAEVRNYLAQNFGPQREERRLRLELGREGADDEKDRALSVTVPLPNSIATVADCANECQKVLDFINSWCTRFNLPVLPPAHVYCYPL